MSEKEIFKLISNLESKFRGDEYYDFAIDGLICNIGADQKNINVINYAIKRLKEKIKIKENNEHIYDLGNCLLTVADIACPYPYDISILIENRKFNEAKKHFAKVKIDLNTSFERAFTNSANILEKYGRNLEAIYLYDRVIKVNPDFGMALANKALAIDYYIRLSPSKSFGLMRQMVQLLGKALTTDSIDKVGGPSARESFARKMTMISGYLEAQGQLHIRDKIRIPKSVSPYHRFCLENSLFLNFDFGYYYDKHSIEDTFFPSFVDSFAEKQIDRNSVMSERIYFSFQVFNQILESYTSARFLYYTFKDNEYNQLDRLIRFTYTLDYTRHGHKYGVLKSIIRTLYDCLDKIGHLVHYYFSNDEIVITKDIHFNWLLSESFKMIILEKKNYQLLALRNLALEFEEGYEYNYLNKIRNRITHSFLNINEGIAYDKKFSTYEITEQMLVDAVEQLFLLVKAATMYSVIAISSIKPEGLSFSMNAVSEDQIFF